ncbi:hypothetical protein MLD38_015978 [Melastoma candidum]|uniref:Uncharacterized protein n=1 Tax=Melastoma candidum TaxID=119954 RepID=A0ACB9RI23_9MYRT|nr:hypothetical protein MLD38_015978 [Melastoma candidum]
MPVEPTGCQIVIIGRNRWKLLVYTVPLSLFLVVADSADLPDGWTRSVDYSLTVVNQRTANSSLKQMSRSFCADRLYISSLGQYISELNDEPKWCLRSPSDAQNLTLDEVEDAKRSLKECLTDLFKLNMKDRLAEALSTLSRAEVGLSISQLRSVRAFWDGFGDFTSDFLTFERYNAEFELHKLLKDQMLSKMKEDHKKYITLMSLSEEIRKEKEECKRKMEGICKRQEELETECAVALAGRQSPSTWSMRRKRRMPRRIKGSRRKGCRGQPRPGPT